MTNNGYFLYFAYGSNLLKERLHLKNPSAVFLCKGRLKNYALKFGLKKEAENNRWHGGLATIQESRGDEVWGAVWKIGTIHLHSLDEQELVSLQVYSPVEVKVEAEGGELLCRSYQMNDFEICLTSPQYKQVVCSGARQSGLPDDYINMLDSVETNTYDGATVLDDIRESLK
ncbi:gamma-glutamylcyclotransferase-like [Lepisosteus oculatus]|uniref:gamma-glutamylcyclotransferase-like n=1 Tax=Lepisosteus oculatus TaxID=7918 RepID=UPI0035F508D3